VKRFYLPMIALTVVMFYAALGISFFGNTHPIRISLIYFAGEVVPFVSVLLCYVFACVARLARQKADHPLREVWAALKPRLALAPIPLMLFPLFMGGFTSAKSAIPLIYGYHWDLFLAALDQRVFGVDPWRITHGLMGTTGTEILQFFYIVAWLTILVYVVAAMPFVTTRERAVRFYTAFFGTWLIGGFVLAYLLSSMGPIFVHLIDPRLGAEFAPLKADLVAKLPEGSGFLIGPDFLERVYHSKNAMIGSGISAMPSMHIATTALYVMVARRTWLFWPAVAFSAIIMVGSVHSGFHYFVDAPVGVAIAALCWSAAGRYHAKRNAEDESSIRGDMVLHSPALTRSTSFRGPRGVGR
jgi:hypothetical protein